MKLIAIFSILLLLLSSAESSENPTELTDSDKIYGLSLFWQEVNYSFAFFDQVPDLDWDSAYREYIPLVLATENTYDYYRVLQRFSALLEDGHTSVVMPDYFWDSIDRPKIGLLEVQERIYISNVDTSFKETIPIGSELIAVDGKPTRRFMIEDVFPYFASSTDHWRWYWCGFRMLAGWRDTKVEITYRSPDSDTVAISLVRNRDGLEWYPPIEYSDSLTEFRWLEDGVAYVALNGFNNPLAVDNFREYLPDLESAKGIVIDLRENGGGSTGIGSRILSHFSTDTLIGSTWKTREHRGAHKAWGKFDTLGVTDRRAYFEGTAWYEGTPFKQPPADGIHLDCPVAVLVSHSTGSAAEDFLVMCDPLEQFTIVGEASNGSTGQPIVFDLPGGGWARVCAKRDTYPDGRDFVGVGVQPDIPVEPTPETAFTDEDLALDRAVEHLLSMMK